MSYQNTWDVSRAQPGDGGILVDYTGGTIGASFTGTAQAHAVQFLSQLEPVLPGISAPSLWNGRATLGLLARQSLHPRLVLVLEGRPVHGLLGI